MNEPIMFGQEMILDHFNIQPSVVKGRANAGTEYYKRLLYTKIFSTLDFKLPEEVLSTQENRGSMSFCRLIL